MVFFESELELPEGVEASRLWISASQRFELFVNELRVARGPSRSDSDRWGVVPVTIPALAAGRHALRARVWHGGAESALAQMGPPAFLLAAPEHPALGDWRAGPHWRCRRDRSRRPLTRHAWGPGKGPHDVAGPGEAVDLRRVEGDWTAAVIVARQPADTWGNVPLGCRLRPDPLPQMRAEAHAWARVAQADPAISEAADAWLRGGELLFPAGKKTRVVLDAGTLVNGWITLDLAGGRGARIELITAEAPSRRTWHDKAPRDETRGVRYRGHRDRIICDGTARRVDFLWFRSFRYLALEVRAGEVPLRLRSVEVEATGFPLPAPVHATFSGPALADIARLQAVSDRTIALCAHELIFDCPHYEQCQFPGDSRLQALYHYAIHDEGRLALKAIDDFHASRLSDGMLQCRWPSRKLQILPTFALVWIGMLDDCRIWRGGAGLTRYLPTARGVLEWFLRRLRPDGLPGRIPFAPFIDWTPGFERGNAPQDAAGGSAIIALMLASACREMAALERHLGQPETAPRWSGRADDLVAAVRAACWDAGRGLFADTAARASFSLHAQCEAIRAGLGTGAEASALLERSMADDALIQPGTFYYRHYLFEAARLARRPALILDALPRWESCLDLHHLDTWPETDGPTPRSDCHAWSAMPVVSLATAVLGLRPDPGACGAERVVFDPQPDRLENLAGSIPTAQGRASVSMRREAGAWQAEIDSPVAVLFSSENRELPPGRHRLEWLATDAFA